MRKALAFVCCLLLAATVLIVAGIYLLAGLPWALISAGLALFSAAVAIRSGLTRNG